MLWLYIYALLFVHLIAKIYVQKLLCGDKRTQFCIQNSLLNLLDASCNFGVLIEVALECLIDTLVHPILILAVAVGYVVAVGLNVVEILLNTLLHLLESCVLNR